VGITASEFRAGLCRLGRPTSYGAHRTGASFRARRGSLAFLPEEAVRVLRNIREKYEQRVWRRYGFVDAFNPLTNWYSPDVIGSMWHQHC